MEDIIVQVSGFILIILLGYLLKYKNILQVEDSRVISKIIMNVTLPAALIPKFQGTTISASLALLIPLGIAIAALYHIAGYMAAIKRSSKTKILYMMNTSGFNIGNFTIPVVQAFLPAISVVAICMYDIGNSIMTLGLNPIIGNHIIGGHEKPSPKKIMKKLFSSVALNVYLLMFCLALIGIKLPLNIIKISEIVGAANPFLGMFMIGLAFEIRLTKKEFKEVYKVISLKYIIAVFLSVTCYLFLPMDIAIRQAMAILCFAPVSSIAVIYTEECGGDIKLAGLINSLCIPISMFFMTGLIIAFNF